MSRFRLLLPLYIGLTIANLALACLLTYGYWGYVFTPPTPSHLWAKLARVDAICDYNFSGTPAIVTDLSTRRFPTRPPAAKDGRLLKFLAQQGRLPAAWSSSCGVPNEELTRLVRSATGIAEPAGSFRWSQVAGTIVAGHDQEGNDILFISTVDNRGMPDFRVPCHELVFAKSRGATMWTEAWHGFYYLDGFELASVIRVRTIFLPLQVILTLAALLRLGTKRAKARRERSETSSIPIHAIGGDEVL